MHKQKGNRPVCAGQAAEDASLRGNSPQTLHMYVGRALDQEQKGVISHTVLGKSLPLGASVSLSAKTSKCHLHLQDCGKAE